MRKQDVPSFKLPDTPGVYFFRDARNHILYIGKATSLKDRVRSYFTSDVIDTRGPAIVQMVETATQITFETCASALEALLLEAKYIKKHKPKYNTRDKDDKSLNYIIFTDEEYPRVLPVREKELYHDSFKGVKIKYSLGPFPSGTSLKDALRIVRKIFPYRDKCMPNQGTPCFNKQIGLCPGVCTGEISKREYGKTVRTLRAFLNGKRREVVAQVNRNMKTAAKNLEFERASEYKRTLFALEHINDIALIRDDLPKIFQGRVEAYDIAHTSGKEMVGVMVAVESGRVNKGAYRRFKIRSVDSSNDPKALSEVLERRLAHTEWRYPTLIVADGGVAQKRALQRVLKDAGVEIPVVAVVKDERHKPKNILGNKSTIVKHEREILLANAEAHRFAVAYHRAKRDNIKR
jgi:excinuclease ABC subunit C